MVFGINIWNEFLIEKVEVKNFREKNYPTIPISVS
jgi:hypothetical protein